MGTKIGKSEYKLFCLSDILLKLKGKFGCKKKLPNVIRQFFKVQMYVIFSQF